MAKIKWSGLGVTDGRGKLGGTILSRNQYGPYEKAYVMPTNTTSIYTSAVRTNWANLCSSWKSLTQAERNLWEEATTEWKRSNIFADSISLSGMQLFISLNQNLFQIGEPTITTPPDKPSLPHFNFQTPFITTVIPSIIINLSSYPADWTAIISATKPLPATTNYFKNLLNKISTSPGGAAHQVNIAAAYQSRYLTFPSIGEKVGIRIKLVHQLSGASTTIIIKSAIAGI